jgi:hypothetical protein
MSSSSASITAVLALALTACVDASARFDEFSRNVVDASTVVNTCSEPGAGGTPLAELPDISGEHLLAIKTNLSSLPLQFRCAAGLSPQDEGGLLDLSCTPLDKDTRTDVGDPLGQDNVLVNPDGAFCATFVGTVPGAANPISGSDVVTDDDGLELSGLLQDADAFCGTFEGNITAPFNGRITGSFGAIRITPGATGDDLPQPVLECPPT